MPLTATKSQTASLLGVSEDTVENLLHQGRLRRTLGNRFVHVTLESVAEYTHLPLELVVNEFRLVPHMPAKQFGRERPWDRVADPSRSQKSLGAASDI
jgi:hypothetical protein